MGYAVRKTKIRQNELRRIPISILCYIKKWYDS